MDVYCNQFVQICPANYGQWHNTITLDIEKPNTLVFNTETYQSRWTYTMSRDGQWSEISFTFSRHHNHGGKFWTEHYTRIGPEIWSLLHRSQIPQQHHYGTAHGRFYDVPVKLLRLQACDTGTHRIRHNARGYCPTRGFFGMQQRKRKVTRKKKPNGPTTFASRRVSLPPSSFVTY